MKFKPFVMLLTFLGCATFQKLPQKIHVPPYGKKEARKEVKYLKMKHERKLSLDLGEKGILYFDVFGPGVVEYVETSKKDKEHVFRQETFYADRNKDGKDDLIETKRVYRKRPFEKHAISFRMWLVDENFDGKYERRIWDWLDKRGNNRYDGIPDMEELLQ